MNLKEKMTALADAVRAKADLTDTLTIDEMTDAVNGLAAGNLTTETLTVTPSKSVQSFSSSALRENTYYSTVTVNAIPAEYITTTDATAVSGDILYMKTAYVNGRKVTGNMTNYGDVEEQFSNTKDTLSINANGYFKTIKVNLVRKTLEVTPTKSAQTLRASYEGSDVFYTQVNVAPIPAEYINTTDATAEASDIVSGKTAYVNGVKIEGAIHESSPYASGNVVTIPEGVITEQITVELPFSEVAVSGNCVEIPEGWIGYEQRYVIGTTLSVTVITPSAEDQIIPAESYTVSDVTIKGDSALIPENIKKGVSIFNVEGEFEGIDTSDATVTAADLLEGVTAYGAEGKVTGTISTVTPSLEGNVFTVPSGFIAEAQTLTVGTSKSAETCTPGTADITISADTYLAGPLTIKGDGNLTADNIKTGVSIFNVEGTFTADADATASDIAQGKTAYVNGEKITGTASLASGYNIWGFLNYRLVQETPTSDHIPVPSQRRGSFHCINGKILWISGSTIATESEPLADVEYLYSPPSASPTAYGIADGRLYYFWENGYGVIQRRPLAQELTNVSELCVVNGDRCLCKDGSVIYAVNRDDASYRAVSGLSASKMLNYYSYSKAAVITTSGDIAQVYWYDNDPSYNISDADKGNGNPFTNVNYVGAEDIYLDYGGAAYMLAFRETGFWYKNIFNSDSPWIEKTDAPDLIRTNLLGYCVTSREEYYNYDPDTGEESRGYVNKEKEVALHIDTSGRLWKIAAACDDNGNGTGLNITQVGSDSDWQYVPPSIKPGQSINNRRFAQKGGKLIMLKTDNECSMGITWEEYPFSPNGRMILYSEDGPTAYFSVSGNLPDLTRAGGMI